MTNIELITAAYRLANVIDANEVPSAEQGVLALQRLNQMLEAWTEDELELGYFEQTDQDAACPIPKWSERAVIGMFSLDLCAASGLAATQEQIAIAETAFQSLRRKCIVERLEPADMRHMPRGAGHIGTGADIETDSL